MEGGNSVKGERGGEYWKTDGAVAAVSVSHAAEAFHSFSPLETISSSNHLTAAAELRLTLQYSAMR